MNKIDWSKAPVGATHYMTPPTSSPWRDLSGENWKWLDENGAWNQTGSSSKGFLELTPERLIPVPAHMLWSGEGLPSVGTVCEYAHLGDDFDVCRIEAYIKNKVVFTCPNYSIDPDAVFMTESDALEFRPIRTPEQIAAEEREAVRTEVLNAMTAGGKLSEETEEQWQYRLKVVGEMLDMGYRKQEAK